MLTNRERSILYRLYSGGPASRLELARYLNLTPNLAGDLAAGLIQQGILREADKTVRGRGRPSIPLEIDTSRRHFVGLSIQAGFVEVARLNLRGQPVEPTARHEVDQPGKIIRSAARILSKSINSNTLAIGVSVTGFADANQKRLLLSSAIPGQADADLTPLLESAGKTPLHLQNDMHALAARWVLQHDGVQEDVLLVLLADGQVGSTLLINGRPNDGCVLGGNELGHMRLPIPTDRCFCGKTGCFERIFSSEYARARLGLVGSLPAIIAAYDGRRSPLSQLISLTANSLANAVNFVRPHRLVLISPFTRHAVFANELLLQTRDCLLNALAQRVRIDLWEQPASTPAETAAFLPMASLYLDTWA